MSVHREAENRACRQLVLRDLELDVDGKVAQ